MNHSVNTFNYKNLNVGISRALVVFLQHLVAALMELNLGQPRTTPRVGQI